MSEIQLKLSDDIQACEVVVCSRVCIEYPYPSSPTKSEWVRARCLLLAQVLAVAFVDLIIGNSLAVRA